MKIVINKKFIEELSSNTRFNILKLLTKKEQSIEYLSEQLNISSTNIRVLIKKLQEENLIIRKQRDNHKFVTFFPTKIVRALFN